MVDRLMELPVIDVEDFETRIVAGYNDGSAEKGLPADLSTARSIIPAGTAALRDFSYIAPEIPLLLSDNCVGCMDCVTQCPDTAILGKAIAPGDLEAALESYGEDGDSDIFKDQFTKTKKYFDNFEKKIGEGAMFGIFIDPTKCKGCAECVDACGDHEALTMITKTDENRKRDAKTFDFYKSLPETPKKFRVEKSLQDMMLADSALLYVGGAGSCAGCGEGTALRMLVAANGFVYGEEGFGIVASTGCNTVYTSTYPYNPYRVPWMNSLFENNTTVAMGLRTRWDQLGWQDKKLWCIGGDGAMMDIGFQALSRMLASGMNIKVFVLDTQVYSNTGGQASTSTYLAQDTKMAFHGKVIHGKTERRKELGQICMMHPDVFVAQTTCAHPNHIYKAIMDANEYDGPAVITVFTTCQPEHKVGDDMAAHQAKLAVDSRAFPIYIYDPRLGSTFKERLSLRGNPAPKEDWYTNPKSKEQIDFVTFARSEGRFKRHFDKEGSPSDLLLAAKDDRLQNWRQLQELAGII